MAFKHVISIVSTAADATNPFISGDKQGTTKRLATLLMAKASGTGGSSGLTMDCRTSAVSASKTVTISGADGGAYATVINGVSIASTGVNEDDTATAAAIVVAVNASTNALVLNLVTAAAVLGVVTITAKVPGVTGNCITLSSTGTGATAGGTRLTGGTETVLTY